MTPKHGRWVAPYKGAWIEIRNKRQGNRPLCVAPYMGAWIEIRSARQQIALSGVAPYMGAWIEIGQQEE